MKNLPPDNPSPKLPVYLVGAVMILLVSFCDWWTGPDLSLALCYLIPTTFVAWRAGLFAGLMTGVASTFAWLGVELAWNRVYSHEIIPYANGVLQLSVTIFSAVVTAAVSERNRKLRVEIGVREEIQSKLHVLNETLELRVAERSAAAEKRAEELERSEAALRRQTSILKSILTSMGDGVVVTDDVGCIRLYNPAAARLLRMTMADKTVSEWTEQIHLLLRDLLAQFGVADHVLLPSLQGEPVDGLELCLRSGAPREQSWVSLTTRPLIDDKGEFHGAVFVFNDITTRKQVDRLAADISEREQERIGQDLHDGLGQHLVSTAFAVTLLKDKLAEKNLPEAEDAAEIADLLGHAVTQSQNLARGLYPVKLEVEGLSSALAELAGTVSRTSGVMCRFVCAQPPVVYEPGVGTNLYRLAQEAINNAVKHGQPTQIQIHLGQKDSVLTLMVVNDGLRFVPPAPKYRGMGLHIMNYRARMMGAELHIGPGMEGGTVVRCTVPNFKRLMERI